MLTDIFIRGDFPRWHHRLTLIRHRLEGKKDSCPTGYAPPVVEYKPAHGSQVETITVRDTDLPFLCTANTQQAADYLALIIRARQQDDAAKQKLRVIQQDYLESYTPLPGLHTVKENEYMVPSTSTKTYRQEFVSNKGASLLHLVGQGYPVPDFVILTAKSYCLEKTVRQSIIAQSLESLQVLTGKRLGCRREPLLIALRSAMPFYIPGFMPTYLNVGLNNDAYEGLLARYGTKVAGKIRFNNLKTIYQLLFPGRNNEAINRISSLSSAGDIEKGNAFLMKQVAGEDPRLLTDAYFQVAFFIHRAHAYFLDNMDLLLTFMRGRKHYPSLIMQEMVCTVVDEHSYAGVLYSVHPRTGRGMKVESIRSIFGEEIMTGSVVAKNTEFFQPQDIKERFPAVYHFVPRLKQLEQNMASPVTVEFVTSSTGNGSFIALIQLNQSELTGRSALLSAVRMHAQKRITASRVADLVKPYHLRQIMSDTIQTESFSALTFFSRGIAVLPRTAVTAQVFFSSSSALQAKRSGIKVCLCKQRFRPEDTIVMGEVDAIISLTPAAVHVVTSCRGYGIPAFINLEKFAVRFQNHHALINRDGIVLREGDWITVSSKRQEIYKGRARYVPARFQRYIDGENLALTEKETKVFPALLAAYREYKAIIHHVPIEQIFCLSDLAKLIQTDFRDDKEKAVQLVNEWFDRGPDCYVTEVLKSELGMHLEQNRIYSLLSEERRIHFFKSAINRCIHKGLQGFFAGSFMLGRFMCTAHAISFWEAFKAYEIAFMLNEWLLFQKYVCVLNKVGERKISRARNEILSRGLRVITIRPADVKVFMTLKLSNRELALVQESLNEQFDEQIMQVLELLGKPYAHFYDYDQVWSVNQLKGICRRENIPLPHRQAV